MRLKTSDRERSVGESPEDGKRGQREGLGMMEFREQQQSGITDGCNV